MAVISGTVLLGPGETPGRATVLLLNEAADSVVASTESDPVTGAYSFDAPGNQTYRVVVMGDGAYRSRAYGPVVTADFDPHWANVVSLLHFDGADGSDSFTDERGVVWSKHGPAQLDTDQKAHGDSSLYLPGTAALTASSSGFVFGTGDFTVEFLWRLPSTGGINANLVYWGALGETANPAMGVYMSSMGWLALWGAGSDLATGATIVGNQFRHVAIARAGTSLRFFIDGQVQGVVGNSANISGSVMKIGRFASENYVPASHCDEFRVTKGVARYTANFTPPTAPFPNSGP